MVVTCTPKTIELYHYSSLRGAKRWRKLGTYRNVAIDTAICREPLVNINVNGRELGFRLSVKPGSNLIWQADRPRSVTGRNSALESVPTNAESEDPGHRNIISIIDYVKSNGQMLIT
jgi:hypothetical protein